MKKAGGWLAAQITPVCLTWGPLEQPPHLHSFDSRATCNKPMTLHEPQSFLLQINIMLLSCPPNIYQIYTDHWGRSFPFLTASLNKSLLRRMGSLTVNKRQLCRFHLTSTRLGASMSLFYLTLWAILCCKVSLMRSWWSKQGKAFKKQNMTKKEQGFLKCI